MKACSCSWILVIALLIPIALPAQEQSEPKKQTAHHYIFFEVPTFGGPNFLSNFLGPQNSLLSQSGTLVGGADTSVMDPFCFNCSINDPFVEHAFTFQDGVLTDLGTLPGGVNSQAFWINARGLTVGLGQIAEVDPYLGIQELRAVVWEHGRIVDLGTFGGHESLSQAVNDRGQVVGIALNTIPDPISPIGFVGTQMRAFLWEKGVMQDLGTLGGPDAWARYINNGTQIAGVSFTNSAINPETGQPTTHAFLWQHGEMRDLGTLGGTFSEPFGLNNRGQVVGQSNVRGDPGCNGSVDPCVKHAFFWERGSLKDIGTLGGSYSEALGVNESGEVVGLAGTQNDQANPGFVWKAGVMTDLGALTGDDCSIARAINSWGQIVGTSYPCATGSENAALWDNGAVINLNRFVPPGSDLHLTGDDAYINDRGEIAGTALRPNGDVRAFLLIPCGEITEDCRGVAEGAAAAIRSGATPKNSSRSPQPPGTLKGHNPSR